MSEARSVDVRRVGVTDEDIPDSVTDPDYSSAFEIIGAGTGVRSPEQWARDIFDGAPRPRSPSRRGRG